MIQGIPEELFLIFFKKCTTKQFYHYKWVLIRTISVKKKNSENKAICFLQRDKPKISLGSRKVTMFGPGPDGVKGMKE